ncbi:MAG: lysine-sensitive aspartokinase 3 [Candidatus Peregrinibacteria bacterium]|nr:lysine-sensitive aspartokinase 3 [Candidatus Peregrinibacteria bacterium]
MTRTQSPIIMKFGGTSLGSGERITNAAQIVATRKTQNPVLATSAMSQITNTLIATAEAALTRKESTVRKNLKLIRAQHFTVAKRENTRTEIEKLIQKLEYLCEGILMIGELSPRSLDLISSYGERMSSWLMVEALESIGLKAQRFDSQDLIQTNDSFGNAEVEWKTTTRQIKKALEPAIKKGIIPVVTGYIGSTKNGETTTLGRGGSDYSAAILGVSLNAAEIQIWTDVDGMMTADPRVVSTAKMLPQVSFQEAAELAYFGAKVLHPKTIQPAVESNIPVRILNTMNPKSTGTTIVKSSPTTKNTIKAIASKKNISIINICSTRMFGPFGFLARIFNTFAKHEVSVDVVATSEVSVSVTVEDGSFSKELIRDLEKFSNTKVTRNQTLISVVGNGLKDDYRVEAQVFQALAKAKISNELISKGASQINLTFLVPTKNAERTVKTLHEALF